MQGYDESDSDEDDEVTECNKDGAAKKTPPAKGGSKPNNQNGTDSLVGSTHDTTH